MEWAGRHASRRCARTPPLFAQTDTSLHTGASGHVPLVCTLAVQRADVVALTLLDSMKAAGRHSSRRCATAPTYAVSRAFTQHMPSADATSSPTSAKIARTMEPSPSIKRKMAISSGRLGLNRSCKSLPPYLATICLATRRALTTQLGEPSLYTETQRTSGGNFKTSRVLILRRFGPNRSSVYLNHLFSFRYNEQRKRYDYTCEVIDRIPSHLIFKSRRCRKGAKHLKTLVLEKVNPMGTT